MNDRQLKALWEAEEKAGFQGWDFGYIQHRTKEQRLPWSYRAIVEASLGEKTTLLDMGTGGGEFLRSLHPPAGRAYATEAYPPNVELCRRTLPAYGIEVRQVYEDDKLPFPCGMFDLVINRHESFSAEEAFRVLKPGGRFITQQVGGRNNRELARTLLGEDVGLTDPEFDLAWTARAVEAAGFAVEQAEECFPELTFLDVGALVYFARIIEWEFPGFSVERCFGALRKLHEEAERGGGITTMEHRFLLTAVKPGGRSDWVGVPV
ncbi:class I SAM-dependent methyltransferase [Paenibacillus methanolicus]|uniref:Methyltransferase family protein n=1 Tax=Paenibacillus methanolicus TaxID=582686 RepID=A0A5S5BVN3_9BACL|nr:class I SAM-dependent methyltransferase [Paenibacillus methanolicus]TYP70220.1 methyltransferase family protein [Paenibacillus methanolicus]